MLMALGNFIFELKTLPFQTRTKTSRYRWTQQDVIGARPLYQFLGDGEKTLGLSGVLYPEITGSVVNLSELEALAARGESQRIVDANGYIHGMWFIDEISSTETAFFEDGTARKIEFEVALRYHQPQQEPIALNYAESDFGSFA